MKLQTLTIIFIIIILPVVLVLSSYIDYEIQTIYKQNNYNKGVIQATHDAIFSFELNTKNDSYSNNAENKRANIKAAVKTFENSLSSTCNLGLYNNTEIEEYIPAMLFGLYDGFYMYAPSQNGEEYKHNLRSYVYYSEQIPGTDIVIRYTLDNYVAVSGTIDGTYQTMAGYLIGKSFTSNKYDGVLIEKENLPKSKKINDTTNQLEDVPAKNDNTAITYFNEAKNFTTKFNNLINSISTLSDTDRAIWLINATNDPEDENSAFVTHKREIMKEKIETVLNSSITAYAKKTGSSYRMPKLLEEEWEKIYTNISVIAFVQGMNLGFKKYNNYCVLNSTNNSEFVNPNLLYFIDNNGYYHDITCSNLSSTTITSLVGYKIGDFEKIKYEVDSAAATTDAKYHYYYKHEEYACYDCINGGGESRTSTNIYDYINKAGTPDTIKKAYYTSLARERQNTVKLLDDYNK